MLKEVLENIKKQKEKLDDKIKEDMPYEDRKSFERLRDRLDEVLSNYSW